jgi:hypothetical protein
VRFLRFAVGNLHYLLILGTVLYVGLQPILEKFFPSLTALSSYTLLTIGLATMVAFAIHFDQILRSILNDNRVLENLSLEESINKGAEKLKNNINELKVFAFTTAVIHPIVRSGKFRVKKCRLMLHRFDEDGPIEDALELNHHNRMVVKRWQDLKDEGIIDELEIVIYTDRPHDYFLIMDDVILIQGFYFYKDNSPHGNLFEMPVLITPENIEAKKLTDKGAKRFENMWRYWHEKEIQL